MCVYCVCVLCVYVRVCMSVCVSVSVCAHACIDSRGEMGGGDLHPRSLLSTL